LLEALLLEARVADGQHLVDDQDLGLELQRDENARRRYMPLEYVRTGWSITSVQLRERATAPTRRAPSRSVEPREHAGGGRRCRAR
jgi:hypothetical protein